MYTLCILCVLIHLFLFKTKDTNEITMILNRDSNEHVLTEVISPLNKTYLLDYKENITLPKLLLENTDLFTTSIFIGSKENSLNLIPDLNKNLTVIPCGLSYVPSFSNTFKSLNILISINTTDLFKGVLAIDIVKFRDLKMNLSFLNEEPCDDPHRTITGYLGLSIGHNDIKCIDKANENYTCSNSKSLLWDSSLKNSFIKAGLYYKYIRLIFQEEFKGSLILSSEIKEKVFYNYCYGSINIEYTYWNCNLNGIFIIGKSILYKEIENGNVVYNPSIDHIRIPQSYYSLFIPFLTFCSKIIINDSSYGIECGKDFDFFNFPIIAFHINNYVYKLDILNLFWKTKTGYFLKILFNKQDYFTLGLPFLKQFDTIFFTENQKVGINKNSLYITSYSELRRSYFVLFLIVSGIVFFLLAVLIIVIIRIQLKKNKKEIPENVSLLKSETENNMSDINSEVQKENELHSQNIQISTF